MRSKESLKKQYQYISDYKKKNVRRILLEFRKDTEQDLIEHLDNQPSKNEYIRQLIRKDMSK